MTPCCFVGNGIVLCRPPALQPLTRYRIAGIGEKGFMWFTMKSDSLAWCHRCRRRRRARNLSIIAQAYYEPIIDCTDETECRAYTRVTRKRQRLARKKRAESEKRKGGGE